MLICRWELGERDRAPPPREFLEDLPTSGTAKQTIAQVPRFFKAEVCMSCPISPTYFPKVPISGRHAPVLSGQRMHTLSLSILHLPLSTSTILFPNTDNPSLSRFPCSLVYRVPVLQSHLSLFQILLRRPAEDSAMQG